MNSKGRFGKFGGQYVPEIVMPALNELEAAYEKYKKDPEFQKSFKKLLHEYAGRPTNLYYAEKLTSIMARRKYISSGKIYCIQGRIKLIML